MRSIRLSPSDGDKVLCAITDSVPEGVLDYRRRVKGCAPQMAAPVKYPWGRVLEVLAYVLMPNRDLDRA